MRTYNAKLSAKVNDSLKRRERIVRIQKRFLALVGILILSILILFGTSIHAFAGSRNTPKTVYKYYTSIRVEKGDTLWSIADEHCTEYSVDKSAYIKEVCELNSIQNETIHAGEHIIVAEYSTEKR